MQTVSPHDVFSLQTVSPHDVFSLSSSEDEAEANPLVVELEEKTDRAERKTNMWFNKGSFAGLEEDDDEDLEIEKMTEDYQKRGGVILGEYKIALSLKDNFTKNKT